MNHVAGVVVAIRVNVIKALKQRDVQADVVFDVSKFLSESSLSVICSGRSHFGRNEVLNTTGRQEAGGRSREADCDDRSGRKPPAEAGKAA